MCTARTQICAHVKDPMSIGRKRVDLTAGGMETQKHCTQGKAAGYIAPAVTSPRGKQPEFPMHCIGTRKLSNLILSNLKTHNMCENVPTLGKPQSEEKTQLSCVFC